MFSFYFICHGHTGCGFPNRGPNPPLLPPQSCWKPGVPVCPTRRAWCLQRLRAQTGGRCSPRTEEVLGPGGGSAKHPQGPVCALAPGAPSEQRGIPRTAWWAGLPPSHGRARGFPERDGLEPRLSCTADGPWGSEVTGSGYRQQASPTQDAHLPSRPLWARGCPQ